MNVRDYSEQFLGMCDFSPSYRNMLVKEISAKHIGEKYSLIQTQKDAEFVARWIHSNFNFLASDKRGVEIALMHWLLSDLRVAKRIYSNRQMLPRASPRAISDTLELREIRPERDFETYISRIDSQGHFETEALLYNAFCAIESGYFFPEIPEHDRCNLYTFKNRRIAGKFIYDLNVSRRYRFLVKCFNFFSFGLSIVPLYLFKSIFMKRCRELEPDAHLRRDFLSKVDKSFSSDEVKDRFLRFYLFRLVFIIPISLLEGLIACLQALSVKTWRLPSSFFVSSSIYHDPIIKSLVLVAIRFGASLSVHDHGGGAKVLAGLCPDERIADRYFGWANTSFPSVPSKFLGYRFNKREARRETDVLVIAYDGAIAPIEYDAFFSSAEKVTYFCELIMFVNSISSIGSVLVRPRGAGSFHSEVIFEQTMPNASVNRDGTLREAIDDSRLLICTYPETTWVEALYSGRPTILVCDPSIFQFTDYGQELFQLGTLAGCIVHDFPSASSHVREICADLECWWESKEVQAFRKCATEIWFRRPPSLLNIARMVLC